MTRLSSLAATGDRTGSESSPARFIGRQRLAGARAVAERFGISERKAHARLRERVFHHKPGVYLASGRGLALAGLRLPAARVDLRSYAAGRTTQAIERAVAATEANAVRELVQLVELPAIT